MLVPALTECNCASAGMKRLVILWLLLMIRGNTRLPFRSSRFRPRIQPSPVDVGFIVDKVTLGYIFVRELRVFFCQYHSTSALCSLFYLCDLSNWGVVKDFIFCSNNFFFGTAAAIGPRPHFRDHTITFRHTTLDRTSLDE
jgi:hypothetical protein